MKNFALYLFLIGGLLTSCSSSDDDNDDDGLKTPLTYQFARNGSTTVSYTEQTNVILMAEEFITALEDNGNTNTVLNGMFTNSGNYFSKQELNQSTMSLRGKTAASNDYYSNNVNASNTIRTVFDGWIENQVDEVFPYWNSLASNGTAGRLFEADGLTERRVNAKGLQYHQAISKSLLGGLMVDQILNNYLSKNVLDAGDNRINNDNQVLVAGKNYTDMEHKWDEAFGYAYGTDNALAPQLRQDLFLNKYISRVQIDSDFRGIADDIYNAFKLGRAAIVAKDYELRDRQADILKEKISEIMGVRSVYYLRQGKRNLSSDKANAFHDLSEGYGFIYGLQFTRRPGTSSPYFSKAEVEVFLAQLMSGNGFWDIPGQTIDDIAFNIANRFNFTVEQAEN